MNKNEKHFFNWLCYQDILAFQFEQIRIYYPAAY